MRGDVRHLPLDDELRGSGGGAQRLQGAICSSAWRSKTNAEALAAINQPPTAVTTHPFDTRRGEQARAATSGEQSRDTTCTSKPGCSSSLTAFFVLSAVVYAVLTAMFSNGGVEWAGVTALVMTMPA